ncbi:B3 domain-containing protein At2g31420 [Quercus suber]|uniref:B3 domain-containing protein At2g31420 n=1 Tax=Quercus suber TaxID=58331 RepID=UPI0032DF16B3
MNTAVPVPKRARFRDQQHLEPPPNLPQKFKDVIKEMGGSDELLVIQKKLFMCDTNMNKNRFSIPFGQILSKDFLTEEEKKKLIEGQKIKAPLIDPELQSHDIFLVQRNNPDVYVLRNTWNNVHTSNDLKKDDVVQLWSFRARQQACDDASSSVYMMCGGS